MSKRILLGFLIALALGGGAGAAIGPLAESMSPPRISDQRPPNIDPGRVVVDAVEGVVQVLDRGGEWVDIEADSRFGRPARLRTVGAASSVSLAFRGVRLAAGHDAELMLSAPGPEPAVLVTRGHVRVHRGAADIELFVPDREVKLVGRTFGVWVREDEVTVAVLDGELELHAPGRKPIKFARGRELLVNSRRVIPSVLEQRLQIQVQGTSRRGARYTLTGRTAPHARVVHTDARERQDILRVSPAGVFSVDLRDRRPEPGELVAYDAAGRRAEVDAPSITLEEVVEQLSGGVVKAKAPSEAAKPPAAEEASAAKAAPPTKQAPAAPPPKASPPPPPPPKAARERPRPSSERGRTPPRPIELELGGGGVKSPKLEEKPEIDPAEASKPKPKPKPRPKPTVEPEPPKPSADEPAL